MGGKKKDRGSTKKEQHISFRWKESVKAKAHDAQIRTSKHKPKMTKIAKDDKKEPLRAFLIAPFEFHGETVYKIIRSTLEDLGVEIFRFDNISSGARWINAFIDALHASDFSIADVTGNNPNVLYELGYAHALRKTTLIIKNSNSKEAIPFDLEGFQYLVFNSNDLSDFIVKLKNFVNRIKRRKESLR
jgi:hypothetical protein